MHTPRDTSPYVGRTCAGWRGSGVRRLAGRSSVRKDTMKFVRVEETMVNTRGTTETRAAERYTSSLRHAARLGCSSWPRSPYNQSLTLSSSPRCPAAACSRRFAGALAATAFAQYRGGSPVAVAAGGGRGEVGEEPNSYFRESRGLGMSIAVRSVAGWGGGGRGERQMTTVKTERRGDRLRTLQHVDRNSARLGSNTHRVTLHTRGIT